MGVLSRIVLLDPNLFPIIHEDGSKPRNLPNPSNIWTKEIGLTSTA